MPQPADKRCANCRFWSDQIAKMKNGKLMAMCLNCTGLFFQQFTAEKTFCAHYAEDTQGCVDEMDKDYSPKYLRGEA